MVEKILAIVRERRKRRKHEARDSRRDSQSRRRREHESASQKREGVVPEIVGEQRERNSALRESSQQVAVPSQVQTLCSTVTRRLEDDHRRRGKYCSTGSDGEEKLTTLMQVRLDAVTGRLDAVDNAIESLRKQQEDMSTITEQQRARLDIVCTAIEAIRDKQDWSSEPMSSRRAHGEQVLRKELVALQGDEQVLGASLEENTEDNTDVPGAISKAVHFRDHLANVCCKSVDRSVWSLPLFVFLEPVECDAVLLNNILAVFCMLLNVIVQVLFVIIVAFKFTESEPALAGAQKWRATVGHWQKYADSAGIPMA